MKILLVRFSAIGDCVMTAWAANSVRNKYPEAEIVWVAEPRCQPVIARSLVELVDYPRDRWKKQKNRLVRLREEMALWTSLRKRRFDWGLDFQGHSKTALLLRFAGPRKRLMARATDLFASRLNPLMPGDSRSMHVIDWNYAALARLGEFDRVERPTMPEPSKPDNKLATICVGSGARDKNWPIDRWAEVGRRLLANGYKVVYLGAQGDPDPGPVEGAQNYIGKLPLEETVRMVGGSALHLAADTGTGHVAAAYGVRAISIFGPTPVSVFRPYSDRTVVLKRGIRTDAVTVEDVMEAACQGS